MAGGPQKWRLLVLDQADSDGDRGPDRLPCAQRRIEQHIRRRGAGQWRERRQAALRRRGRFLAALADLSAVRNRRKLRPNHDSQERQRDHVLVRRNCLVFAGPTPYQQGKLALNVTRDYYLLSKKQDKPTDPITYDLVPLNGPVHIGDILAVRLALDGTDWKYLLAEDPIPAGAEFLAETGLYKLNNKPDWWGDWFTRKEFHDDRAAFFNTEFSRRHVYVYLLKVVNAGKFAISPAQAGPMYQSDVLATTDPATLEVQP